MPHRDEDYLIRLTIHSANRQLFTEPHKRMDPSYEREPGEYIGMPHRSKTYWRKVENYFHRANLEPKRTITEDLFLTCAKYCIADPERSTIESAIDSGKVDWNLFLYWCLKYQTPLIVVNNLQGFAVPSSVMNVLSSAKAKALYRNVILSNETAALTTQFAKSQVNILCFKGAVLAQRYYPSLGLRTSYDIDFFYLSEQAQKAFSVLTRSGYRPCKAPPNRGEHGFVKQVSDCSVLVEMKSNVPFLHRGFEGKMLSRPGHVLIGNVPVPCPGPTEEFVCLLFYVLSNKSFSDLKYLNDFDIMIRSGLIDWDQVKRYWGVTAPLYMLSFQLGQIFGRDYQPYPAGVPFGALFRYPFRRKQFFRELGALQKLLRLVVIRGCTPRPGSHIARDLWLTLLESMQH